jgi:hypothetical protein
MAQHIIGGTTYNELTETTMEQDAAILREVRAVGVESFEPSEGESAEAFLERILLALIEGGQAARLLGCFLVPEGREWTRELAAETGDIFRRVTDPNDKATLRAILMPMLNIFFIVGLASAATSRKYSAALRGILGQPRKTAGTSTSASGRTSSASWLVGILTAPLQWLAGRSGKPSSPTSKP